MTRLAAWGAASAFVLSLIAIPATAQESAGFVVTLGRDTVVMEQFTRTANQLQGVMLNRTPRTSLREYTAQMRPNGSISHIEMTARVLNDSTTPPQVLTMETAPDSTSWVLRQGSQETSQRWPSGWEAFPWIHSSFALVEPVLMYAHDQNRDTVTVIGMQAGAWPDTIRVVRHGADSVLIYSRQGIMRVRVDDEWRVVGVQSPQSTRHVAAARVPQLDVRSFAQAYAQREAQGQGLGVLSPRDSIVHRVAGATVAVGYGKPAVRGRRIFGGLLPYGQFWRTGADISSSIRTDRDLMIAGRRVPAGGYSLWTIPGRDEWTFILNTQTGQWGTEYDRAYDFARIQVQSRQMDGAPLERLTMHFEDSECGDGATLVLEWENTRVLIPFTVVQ
jgi:hypothetical protein